MRRWRRWRPGPRAGRPGCSWPRCRCAGSDDAAAFVAAFTGSHRYVLDYLAEEVLEGQDEQLRTFLLETSVLERLSGPLCDAVTGREGSQALLEEAERAGLFLIPLDEVRGWWRYHHLFADLLRARLQARAARPRGADCTATPRPGTRSTGWPTTPSATRSPPGRCSGRPGSSSSTSTWFYNIRGEAATIRPVAVGPPR